MTRLSVVDIVGARQVGNTTLAKAFRNKHAICLDLESNLAIGVLS